MKCHTCGEELEVKEKWLVCHKCKIYFQKDFEKTTFENSHYVDLGENKHNETTDN